ncbi:MAG: cardiolipin synthase [Prevotella sp.]|nr:cardiolipin synthase [Prevotella sp.]MDD7336284.1 cardiolipin synthase [Prevotella sp.]MDY4626487.1 cardiolipin synthase [Prevotella sp.]MDY5258946.1 cardiolipin synthase [Prevotella sp.]
MIYIHWIFLLLYSIIALVAIIIVIMDNRQPAKTLAWVLVLSFMPIVGIILYFFFGQNIRKERIVSQKSLDELTKRAMLEFVEQRNLQIPPAYKNIINLFINQDWALPFKDNEAEIYTSGYEFFPALLAEIGRAKHHIHIDTFIIEDDALGRLIADALIDKAHEGVQVRLIYDDVGCWNVQNSFFERMREEGIEVHPFMPVKFPAFTSKANYRNHRKVCVIDGTVGFIGGMNLALRYVKGTGTQAWRDTHMKLRGTAVYGLQRAFLMDWYFVDRTLITSRDYYPPHQVVANECLAQVVTSNPTDAWPSIEQGYLGLLTNARRYIYMETPYFLPTEPILFAMRMAALSGVDVRLMIPYRNDSKLVAWASISYVQQIVNAGVKVELYKDGFNHSKLLICDDEVCTCGSANLDFRSFEHDFESNVFFYDKSMTLRLKQVFETDERHCVSFSEWKSKIKSSFWQRLFASVVRMLAPLL